MRLNRPGFQPLQRTRSLFQSTALDETGHRPRKPRAPWQRTLYAVWFAQLLAIMAFSLRAPFLPLFFGDLGVTSENGQALWTGLMLASGAASMALTSPMWGAMADRRGRKLMLLRAQFGAFCTLGLAAFVTAPWQLLGLRVIEGALAGTVTAATALVAASMPRDRLGFGLGMIQMAVFSGSAVGPLVGGFIAEWLGYRPAFGAASLMMFAAGTITLLLVQEEFSPKPATATGAPRQSQWRILLGPVLLSLTTTMLIIRFASSAVQPIIPLFVENLGESTSNTSALSGLTLGILGLTSAISSIYLGRQGDRHGHYRILMVCSLGAGLIYLPMAAVGQPWQLIVLQAVFGVFAGGMIPSANALIARVTEPENRGVVFGLMNSAASFGGFLGPLAGSFIAAGAGIPATFIVTGCVLLAMVGWLILANRRHPLTA